DRLQFMLEDAAPALVLTQERLKAALPATAAPVVALDSDWDAIERQGRSHADPNTTGVTPDSLAYVIYTSGSTGVPKGVMVRQGGVLNLLHALEQSVYAGHPDWTRVSVNASFAFDSSVKQFVQLLSGRTLVLVPQDVRLDADALLRFIGEQRIDVFDCTPSQLVALLNAGMFDGVRRIPKAFLVGGEAIDTALWRSLGEQPDTAFFNVYGPAECTVDATVARIEADEPAPHIGGPIANVRIYILDRHGRPVPAGVVGEICIGGAGVARGYRNRPELTAERFIADPFSLDPKARLYKTGDLGRWRLDGTIAYVGRNDHQVKLRGQRIELGEIETQLSRHAGVREAIVVAREDAPGEKRLVAYVTATGGAVGAEELRAHLLARLPHYMVPAAFVELEALPLTPNRKVDRNALPKPEADAYARKEYEPPQGEIEAALTAIWQELLHVERIGRHDNFFELGGHSLLATQVISKIRGRLDADLPLKTLFERSTVAQLAESIATAGKNGIPPIEPVDRSQFDRLPLSFAQERLWFINQLESDSPAYNVPGAFVLHGELDADRLDEAFNRIIARHESLRTVFPSHEGQAQQRLLDRVDFRLERIDLSQHATPEERHRTAKEICQADATTPFDLANGPLVRGRIIRLSEREHILMLNMHHIVSDGWSHAVLIRELGVIVEALRHGRQPELSPLPIQYADYSVWQRTRLEESGLLEKQLAYWRQKVGGVPESLDLPTDYPRPALQSVAGATQSFALDAGLTARLRHLAERQGGTLYMVLLAAVKTLLHRYTGQNDICVGSPIANRQYGETEGLIGMFVNTLALRTQVEAEEPFTALFAKVKSTCLEAYEHQDAPFEKVVDAVHPQRNRAISPLFQVMVILQNARKEALDPAIEPSLLETGLSKFDLTVEFSETGKGLAGSIEFSTALYKPQTIARMVEHLTALCEAITARPDARICDLAYLGGEETRRLLVDFNATGAEYPAGYCLHDLFAEEAARHPHDIALICGDERLTYQQLQGRSHDLALYLQSQGVQPDSLVGVCMERSLDMVVSLLGILAAGGAYVPLDPAYPEDRLAYMVRDSRASIVLTQETLQETLRAVMPPETQLIAVDRQRAALEEQVAALKARGVELDRQVAPHHLAYVIYTSGSTGQPKGVAIEHHSPVTLVHWAREIYSTEELAGMLASTSICFDLSVYELFVTLAAGGTIILVPNALALTDLPNRESVTLINTVPSAMEELVRAGAIPPSVRTINLAGEPLPARLVDRIYDTTAAAKVYDLYGPSEDTTYSTFVLRT
ncbi:MAG: tycC4, partial [Acidobacteria bacterium]|nr:tycC4 [Acidobacteriota bacterium]